MSTTSGTWSGFEGMGAPRRTHRWLLLVLAGLLLALVLGAILVATTSPWSEIADTVIAPAQSTWAAEVPPTSIR